MSRTHMWLSCTAWHSSVEIAPPGHSSLSCRKHLKLRGGASRKDTSRAASSESLSTELWHTNTSYFLAQLNAEPTTDWGMVGVHGDDKGQKDDEPEDCFASFPTCWSCAEKDPLKFRIFWNHPKIFKKVLSTKEMKVTYGNKISTLSIYAELMFLIW